MEGDSLKVALFGGTGFVGSYIVDELVSREHQPRLMVRPGSEGKVPKPEYCETVSGDIHDDYAIRETLYDCDAAIYLIAVIREFPKEGITNELLQFRGAQRVANIALEVGVKRFLLMSALGTNCGPGASKYFKAKHLAEQAVKNTELSWTILRPSSIFGDPRGFGRPEFCTMLKKDMLNLIPFPGFLPFPVPAFFTGLNPFNAGSFSLSMIHAADVATLFANVLEDDTAIGKTLELGGKQEVSWNEIIKAIASSSGKKIFKMPVPFFAVWLVAVMLDRFTWFPAARDQLQDLVRGNTCDSGELLKKYAIEPIPFTVENLNYLTK